MSSLPPELLYQILSGLYHNGYSLTRAHFAQYALVSKAFAGVVQKLLYETIEIKLWRSGTTPHNFLSSLDAQLTRYPHLKAYVQHVVIDFRGVIDVASTLDPGTDSEGGALINVLESIPGLKSMTLRSQPSKIFSTNAAWDDIPLPVRAVILDTMKAKTRNVIVIDHFSRFPVNAVLHRLASPEVRVTIRGEFDLDTIYPPAEEGGYNHSPIQLEILADEYTEKTAAAFLRGLRPMLPSTLRCLAISLDDIRSCNFDGVHLAAMEFFSALPDLPHLEHLIVYGERLFLPKDDTTIFSFPPYIPHLPHLQTLTLQYFFCSSKPILNRPHNLKWNNPTLPLLDALKHSPNPALRVRVLIVFDQRTEPSPVALERMFGFRELVEYFRGGGEEEREFKGDSHSEEVVCGNGSGSGEHRGYRAQKLQLAIAEFATRGPAYKYVKQQFAGVPPGRVEVVGLAGRPVYARWWMCFPKVAAFGD
ncbi:hypothetical protein CC2G_004258 [Coprinopsis cinerea AmutBmut pab1-1]|nr:hypothetical protein CC2G_004258 [Coprinopsis cinerea AmutBmut pab1-1]